MIPAARGCIVGCGATCGARGAAVGTLSSGAHGACGATLACGYAIACLAMVYVADSADGVAALGCGKCVKKPMDKARMIGNQ